MRVFQDRPANAILANNRLNSRQRYIEPRRFGQLRRKQAELHFTYAAGLCAESQRQDCCMWRMRFKIKVQQLDPEFLIIYRQCGSDGASMQCSTFQREGEGDGSECEDAHSCTKDELFQHHA